VVIRRTLESICGQLLSAGPAIIQNMLETSARLLKLLSLLQLHRDWSGADLADRLGVSARTIRRDMEKLRDLGYPVHASTGITGGYRLGAGAALPPLLLDDEEAVAVAVGLRTAAGGAVAGIEETSVRALTKLEQVLPSRLRHRVNALQSYTVPVPGVGPTVDADVLTATAGACRDHERLRFDYLDHAGTPSLRTVEPHRLVIRGRRWYLVAWDNDRDDWRTYRVDRIRPRTPTGPRFTPREPPAEDLGDYVTRGVSAAPWRYRIRVRLHASKDEVMSRVQTFVGEFEEIDESSCILTTGADNLELSAIHMGMLGTDFEVLEPPELKQHLRALSERLDRAAD
jgi:predicted DNA-binding transcriptional regulator YafY